jgi:hypothetical protein
MKMRIIEATSNNFNWGRFCVARFDSEWTVRSSVEESVGVLLGCGADPKHVWVLDLVTREGACFKPGGLPIADLEKHRIWVCPLFEPFLEWLYKQDLSDLDTLPAVVELPNAENAMRGYRRPGPEGAGDEGRDQ